MTKPCSVCGKPRQPKFYAFCSADCRNRDLLAWGDEAYVLQEDPELSTDDLFSDDLRKSTLDS